MQIAYTLVLYNNLKDLEEFVHSDIFIHKCKKNYKTNIEKIIKALLENTFEDKIFQQHFNKVGLKGLRIEVIDIDIDLTFLNYYYKLN